MTPTEGIHERLAKLRHAIEVRPETELKPVPEETIARFQEEYPEAPEHLLAFFRTIGSADIEDGGYVLCGWMTTKEIYDPVTAAELGDLVVVGLWSTGACNAYDAANGWQFGIITETCSWWPDDDRDRTLIDFLEERYLGGEQDGPLAEE